MLHDVSDVVKSHPGIHNDATRRNSVVFHEVRDRCPFRETDNNYGYDSSNDRYANIRNRPILVHF